MKNKNKKVANDLDIKNKIDNMHEKNLFKLLPMPCFEYKAEVI